jgi:hypothetical protein
MMEASSPPSGGRAGILILVFGVWLGAQVIAGGLVGRLMALGSSGAPPAPSGAPPAPSAAQAQAQGLGTPGVQAITSTVAGLTPPPPPDVTKTGAGALGALFGVVAGNSP